MMGGGVDSHQLSPCSMMEEVWESRRREKEGEGEEEVEREKEGERQREREVEGQTKRERTKWRLEEKGWKNII